MTTDRVFDPGLQPERTLLAWRRTCLSFALASLIGMRFTAERLGAVAVIAGLLGAGLAVTAYFAAVIGYQRTRESLHRTSRLEHGALPMALACCGALVLGGVCALFVVWSAAGT